MKEPHFNIQRFRILTVVCITEDQSVLVSSTPYNGTRKVLFSILVDKLLTRSSYAGD